MGISPPQIVLNISNTQHKWLAAYDLEKASAELEKSRSTAISISKLTRREQQVVNLLLEGCENIEIARQLGISHRTVKACFNRLYLRFGITSGIKRVKLATRLYRSQFSPQMTTGKEMEPTPVKHATMRP
jgi:DNA-binding NarL/FixJ family response regulator